MVRLSIPRKIIKVGDSIAITLPKDMMDTYNLKVGDDVTIIIDREIDNILDDDYIIVIDMKHRGEAIYKKLDRLLEP